MAGNVVGSADIAVGADASKFERQLSAAVVDASDKAVPAAQSAGSKISGAIGKTLMVGATAAAAGVGVVLTTAFVKGFSRLSDIDAAKAKLEGLGVTGGQLQTVMENALTSVKGTAFGLNEAVAAVPSLLAAGVKPGKELTQALTNMGSAATLAGTSFGDISDVFTDAAASGKVTTDTFNRLAQRGIPALQMVADQLGLTQEETKKLASTGQISFQTLQDALTAGIGPAAVAAGQSFQGMLANTMTALGRLGASLLGPAFEGLKSIFPSLIGGIDAFSAALQPIIDAVAPQIVKWFGTIADTVKGINWGSIAGVIVGVFQTLSAAITPIVNALLPMLKAGFKDVGAVLAGINWSAISAFIIGIGQAIAGVLKFLYDWRQVIIAVAAAWLLLAGVAKIIQGIALAMKVAQTAMIAWKAGMTLASTVEAALTGVTSANTAAVIANTIAMLASPWTWIIVAIVAVIAAIVLLIMNWDKVTKFVQQVWGAFIGWFKSVTEGFVSWFSGIWSGITGFFQGIWDGIASAAQSVWNGIVGFLTSVWNGIVAFFTTVWQGVVTVWNNVWNAVLNNPVIQFIGAVIRVYVETWINIFLILAAAIKWVWDQISAAAVAAWNAIVGWITPVVTAIVGFLVDTWNNFVLGWQIIWQNVSSFFQGIWNGLVAFLAPIVQTVIGVLTIALQIISDTWNSVWSNISSFFTTIWSNISSFFQGVWGGFTAILSAGLNAARSLWNSVWGGISSFFSGIWNTIVGALRSAIGQLGAAMGTVFDHVMAPVRGAGTWLVDVGRNIIQGLINGITSMVGGVIKAIGNVVNGAIDWAKSTLGIKSPSTVFAGIGEDLGAGFVKGINQSVNEVEKAVEGMANAAVNTAMGPITNTWQGGATAAAIPVSSTAAGTSSATYNNGTSVQAGAITVQTSDPYKASLLVLDRLAERAG